MSSGSDRTPPVDNTQQVSRELIPRTQNQTRNQAYAIVQVVQQSEKMIAPQKQSKQAQNTTPKDRVAVFNAPSKIFADNFTFVSQQAMKNLDPTPVLPLKKSVAMTMDVRPRLMKENLRGGLFPDMQKQVTEQIQHAMITSAWKSILRVERTANRDSCQMYNRYVSKIEKPVGFWQSLPTWGLYVKLTGKNTQMRGSEVWTVDRCGEEVPYRVNFFCQDGDVFFAKVVPMKAVGLYNMMKFEFRNWFENSY